MSRSLSARGTGELPGYSDGVADVKPFDRALRVLAGTPAVIGAALGLARESEVLDHRNDPEAWSPRQVLAHLLVVERDTIPTRLHRLAAEDNVVFASSSSAPAENAELDNLFEQWAGARASNLVWLGTLAPEVRAHGSIHPRHGRITLDEHVVEWAYHDLDHVRQILGQLAADLYPYMGAWQALYRPPDPATAA